MIERLENLRVALVGYREYDGGPRVEQVDIIAVDQLRSLVSLPPADALVLADQLREVAGSAAPQAAPAASRLESTSRPSE